MKQDLPIKLNPLQRDGTPQQQRLVKALDPAYVSVDERELDDLLQYAVAYAEILQYYSEDNIAAGDWVEFIQKDISTLISSIGSLDLKAERKQFEASLPQLESEIPLKEQIAKNFALLVKLAQEFLDWQEASVEGLKLHECLQLAWDSVLRLQFKQLLAWLQEAEGLEIPLNDLGINARELAEQWQLEIPRAFPLFPDGIPSTESQLQALNRELSNWFKTLFDQRYKVKYQAPDFLKESLEAYPRHQPHIALFLAFLATLNVARQHINKLTQRHLDFYYHEVLKIDFRPEVADQIHLIFELAKTFEFHRVEQETEVIAQKDSAGKDRFYGSDNELIVNKARLDDEHGLKTLFLKKDFAKDDSVPPQDIIEQYTIENIYAAQDADAETLQKGENFRWPTLGSDELADGTEADFGEVGFALSSPMLLLGEGRRDITISFKFDSIEKLLTTPGRSAVKSELENNIDIYLSGEEEWIKVKAENIIIEERDIEFYLTLNEEIPSIIPYDDKVLQDGFNTTLPTIKFIFKNTGLSSLGDIDLSLAAGIAEFELERYYFVNEFVEVEKNGEKCIFQSNGGICRVQPYVSDATLAKDLWELVIWNDIPTYQIPVDDNTLIEAGDLYRDDSGTVFQANGEFMGEAPSINSRSLWLDFSEDTFLQGIPYNFGDIIGYNQKIYSAIGSNISLSPDDDPSAWKEVVSYSSFVDKNDILQGTIVLYKGDYFLAQGIPREVLPDSEELIWLKIERFPDLGTVSSFLQNDLVGVDDGTNSGIIYELNAANIDSDHPRATPGDPASVIWDLVESYNNSIDYSRPDANTEKLVGYPDETDPANSPAIYELNALEALNANPDHILLPNNYLPIWVPLNHPIYETDFNDNDVIAEFSFVISSMQKKIYQVTGGNIIKISGTTDPGSSSGWTEIDDISDYIVGDNNIYSFDNNPDSLPTYIYEVQSDSYFEAKAKNQSTPPSSNPTIWKFKDVAPTFHPTGKSSFLEGEFASVVPGNDASQAGLAITYFQTYVAVVGIEPAPNIPVWIEIDGSVDEFSLGIPYTLSPANLVFVFEKDSNDIQNYFVLNASSQGVSPLSESQIWKKTLEIVPYTPFQFYPKDTFVRHENTLYQSHAGIKGIEPSEEVKFWELVEREDIEEHSFEKAYSIGNLVVCIDGTTEEIYLTNADININGHGPKEGLKIWEEVLCLKEYNSLESFGLNDRVKFEEKVYRPIVSRVFNESPADSPNLWIEIGTLRIWSPSQVYGKGIHVSYLKQIYRARVDEVPMGEKPKIELLPGEEDMYWEPVNKSYPYEYFIGPGLNLESVLLEVDVRGMKNLILENDQGIINSAKPFFPFGVTPTRGSRFYIGSQEVFQKAIKSVNLNTIWGDLPISLVNGELILDLSGHYELYDEDLDVTNPSNNGISPVTNESFSADFRILYDGQWEIVKEPTSLFNTGFNFSGREQEIKGDANAFDISLLRVEGFNFTRDTKLPNFLSFDNSLQRGFLVAELKKDFFHDEFPTILAKAASLGKDGTAFIPPPPYTPTINEFSLDYTAEETIYYSIQNKGDYPNRIEQLFHIGPFGQQEFYPVEGESDDNIFVSRHLVPRFTTTTQQEFAEEEEIIVRDAHGTLLIGLRDLNPPETVAILFQVGEASANADRDEQPVVWSYFRKNRWINFTLREITDDTLGLLRSGVVSFQVPKFISSEHSMMPTDIFWIKGSVSEYPDAVSSSIAVLPQAVKATFINRDNADDHLAKPLEPNSVKSLRERKSAIKSVDQPFASFGGRLKERDNEFYIRVSERLRHKNRAVTIFDFERLILEAYPKLHKAKCLNHTHLDFSPGISREHQPGCVSVIVLPELRNQNAEDPFQPKVDKATRVEIKQYIEKLASDFIEIEIDNPSYEPVRIECEVKFREGLDVRFYKTELNGDLIRFLSPWMFDDGIDINFGGEINAAMVLHYIDQRPYVDYVLKVVLHKSMGDEEMFEKQGELAKASCSSSILVSARQHTIKDVEEPC